MDLALTLLFFIIVVILLVLFGYSQTKTRRRTIEEPYAYKSRQRLFTASESTFLYALVKAVGSQYRIFAKVRLADIVDTEVYKGVGDKAFSLIAYKHVDFLLCDKKSSSILCAVELDDWTHLNEKRRIKDAEKDFALNSASILLARFTVESSYNLNRIKLKILHHIGAGITLQHSDNLSCPECGADTVARLAQSGIHKGNSFVGCSKYPECRFITR